MILLLAAFVAVGSPMAAYIWHVLSDALAGRVQFMSTLIALGLIAVFVGLLRLLVGILPGGEEA